MKEATFTLAAGKEVPERLNGQVIRYTLPEKIADLVGVTGLSATITLSGPDAEKAEQVIIGVFNEGFDLNHRQKIAKRLAAKDGSTTDSITAGMLAHVPGIRAAKDPNAPAKQTGRTKQVEAAANDMLAELRAVNPEAAARYEARLAALAPKPKVATPADAAQVDAIPAAPVADSAAKKANAKK